MAQHQVPDRAHFQPKIPSVIDRKVVQRLLEGDVVSFGINHWDNWLRKLSGDMRRFSWRSLAFVRRWTSSFGTMCLFTYIPFHLPWPCSKTKIGWRGKEADRVYLNDMDLFSGLKATAVHKSAKSRLETKKEQAK